MFFDSECLSSDFGSENPLNSCSSIINLEEHENSHRINFAIGLFTKGSAELD